MTLQNSLSPAASPSSTDPLIVMAKRDPDLPFGLASLQPERFGGVRHCISSALTWSSESRAWQGLAQARPR